MFKAVGFTDEDLSKPLIGVAHTWIESCLTAHLRDLAEHVKRGIAQRARPRLSSTRLRSAMESRWASWMRASLISRE